MGIFHHPETVLITLQGYGLRTVIPFCDLLETRDLQSFPTPQGLFATQGINVAFDAFMTAIAEVDYDTVFGGDGSGDPSDDVRFFSPLAPHLSS